MSPRPDLRYRGEPADADGIRPPTPLEVCQQIAVEHAANTIAAIETERAVRLADRLDDYGSRLSALAEPEGARSGEAAIAYELEATAAPTAVRACRLAELLDSYGVDLDHDQTDPADRYAAVLVAMIDGEAPAAGSFDTLAHACEWLASGPLNTNPREPACVVDLESGQRYTPEVHVTVTLAREEEQ